MDVAPLHHVPAAVGQARVGELQSTARELVGMTFIKPLLQSAHQTALKGKYGHGGRGEEVFAQQLDGVLAERMASTSRFGLVDAITEWMK